MLVAPNFRRGCPEIPPAMRLDELDRIGANRFHAYALTACALCSSAQSLVMNFLPILQPCAGAAFGVPPMNPFYNYEINQPRARSNPRSRAFSWRRHSFSSGGARSPRVSSRGRASRGAAPRTRGAPRGGARSPCSGAHVGEPAVERRLRKLHSVGDAPPPPPGERPGAAAGGGERGGSRLGGRRRRRGRRPPPPPIRPAAAARFGGVAGASAPARRRAAWRQAARRRRRRGHGAAGGKKGASLAGRPALPPARATGRRGAQRRHGGGGGGGGGGGERRWRQQLIEFGQH